ncbi:MAG: hypothetical protein ACSW8J_07970 [bacterium]
MYINYYRPVEDEHVETILVRADRDMHAEKVQLHGDDAQEAH